MASSTLHQAILYPLHFIFHSFSSIRYPCFMFILHPFIIFHTHFLTLIPAASLCFVSSPSTLKFILFIPRPYSKSSFNFHYPPFIPILYSSSLIFTYLYPLNPIHHKCSNFDSLFFIIYTFDDPSYIIPFFFWTLSSSILYLEFFTLDPPPSILNSLFNFLPQLDFQTLSSISLLFSTINVYYLSILPSSAYVLRGQR